MINDQNKTENKNNKEKLSKIGQLAKSCHSYLNFNKKLNQSNKSYENKFLRFIDTITTAFPNRSQ